MSATQPSQPQPTRYTERPTEVPEGHQVVTVIGHSQVRGGHQAHLHYEIQPLQS